MKTNRAVKYIISVWDEVSGNWRDKPDHVQQMFLEAEKEINNTKSVTQNVERGCPFDEDLTKGNLGRDEYPEKHM